MRMGACTVDVRGILPSEDSRYMSRRSGYQECDLHKTIGTKRPREYCGLRKKKEGCDE